MLRNLPQNSFVERKWNHFWMQPTDVTRNRIHYSLKVSALHSQIYTPLICSESVDDVTKFHLFQFMYWCHLGNGFGCFIACYFYSVFRLLLLLKLFLLSFIRHGEKLLPRYISSCCLILLLPSTLAQTSWELVERRVWGAHKKYIISVLISICLSFSSPRMWFHHKELMKSSSLSKPLSVFKLRKQFVCEFPFSAESWVENEDQQSQRKVKKGTMSDKSISLRFILLTCSCRQISLTFLKCFC